MASARRYRTEFIIDGDSSGAVRANEQARDSTERLTQQMGQAERQAGATGGEYQTLAGRLGATVGRVAALSSVVGISAGGLARMVAGTTSAVREQVNLAQSVGVSVQTLQEWSFAARQVGVDGTRMGDIFQDTADKMGDFVATGGGEAADLFERLNLDISRLQSMKPYQQLLAIGDALDDVATQGEKIFFMESIANDASRLLPLLEDNGRLLQKFGQQARDLNVSMSQQDIDTLSRAGQSLAYMREMGTGLAQTLAVAVAPSIDAAADSAQDIINAMGGMEGVVSKGNVAFETMAALLAGRVASAGFAHLQQTRAHIDATLANNVAQNAAINDAQRRAAAERQTAFSLLNTAKIEEQSTRGTAAHAFAVQQLSTARARAATAADLHNTAMVASMQTTSAYTLALGRLAAAGRTAWAALGGLPGIAIAAGSALLMFADNGNDARESVDLLKQSTDEFTASLREMSQTQARAILLDIDDAIDASRDRAREAAYEVERLQQTLNEGRIRGGRTPEVRDDLTRALAEQEDAELALADATERRASVQAVANGEMQASTDAAGDAVSSLKALANATATGGDSWDGYIGKLQSARDTLGMTAGEAAAYAAQQAGYTGLYADMSAAVAGQTDALQNYQNALAQGNAEEAGMQMARAQRFAQNEAMVQAQLDNLGKLSALLQGVQSDLSAVALSAALVVGRGSESISVLVEQTLANINARAQAIRASTTVTDAASRATKELENRVKEAQSAYQSLREEFDPLGVAADEYAEKQRALQLLHEQGKLGAEELERVQAALKVQYQQSIDPLQGFMDRLAPAAARLREYREQVQKLRTAGEAAGRSHLEINAAVGLAAQEYINADRAADPYHQRTVELRNEYGRNIGRAREMERALGDLQQRYQDGEITGDQYRQMVINVRDEMRDLAAESDPLAQGMANAWEEAAERIYETFADAFTGAFDSFSDFSDRLGDGFKRLLGELAYQATLRPIVVSFTQQAQGVLGTGGSGNSALPGGGMGGMGDFGSLGKTVYQSVRDGFGSISWGGVGSSSYAGGGWAGNVASQNSMFGGGSLRNFSGMNGLASMGAGLGGSWLGSEVFGDSRMGGTLSTLGGAAGTFFGGPIGAGIGSFIGSGLGSLFGSSPTPFSGRFGTNDSDARGLWEHDRYYASGALGNVGFYNGGTERLQRAGTGDKEWAKELSDAAVRVDNIVATLAESDAELQRMRDAVQSMQISSSSAGQIIDFALDDRPRAALESVASAFSRQLMDRVGAITRENAEQQIQQLATAFSIGEQIDGLTGNVRSYAERVVNAGSELSAAFDEIRQGIAAHGAVDAISEQLNLQFDALGGGAVEAARHLAELADGLDNLQQQASNYYQQFYTDAERQQRLIAEISPTLRDVGLSAESTREQFRSVVESLNLNTESGREAYSELMNVAGAFAEISAPVESATRSLREMAAAARDRIDSAQDAVTRAYETFSSQAFDQRLDLLRLAGREHDALSIQRERELAAIDESLRPFQRRIWAIHDEQAALESARKASRDYRDALGQASSQLGSTLGNISGWIDQQTATGGAPDTNLQEAQAQFARQLARAESGDRAALESMTQYAERYQSAGEAYYGSGTGYQRIRGEILDALGDLPNQVSAEEYLADEIRQALNDAVDALPGGIAQALSPLFDQIDLNADELIDYAEFERFFSGIASDDQLRAIFNQLDANGDGTISALESVRGSTDTVGTNTGSIESRAGEQLRRLTDMTAGMSNTARGLVGLNDNVVSLRHAINDLASEQRNATRLDRLVQLEQLLPSLQNRSEALYDQYFEMSNNDASFIDSDYWADTLEVYGKYEDARARIASVKSEIEALGGADFLHGSHADGLSYVPHDGYRAELHRGELVATAEEAPAVRAFLDGDIAVPPPLVLSPQPRGHNSAELTALLRENNRLMRENAALLQRIERHGAAGVRVSQAGHQRSLEHLSRIAESNQSLDDRARLEALS